MGISCSLRLENVDASKYESDINRAGARAGLPYGLDGALAEGPAP